MKRETRDFAVIWGGRIQGLLYDDIHRDGAFDNGDPGVSNEMVSLRDERGIIMARTRADGGRFTFSGLKPGPYTVMVDDFSFPAGYRPVDPLEPEVFIEEGRPTNLQIRVQALRAIGGIVYEDTDGDRQVGSKRDLGLGGVEVSLSTGETTRTGPDGSFLFRD